MRPVSNNHKRFTDLTTTTTKKPQSQAKPQKLQSQPQPQPHQHPYQHPPQKPLLKQKTTIIKQQCLKQNHKFKQWAKKEAWDVFHSSHYDWWAFPIDRPSSKGTAYQVEKKEQDVLGEDLEFLVALEQNAILVCRSWGWDLEKGQYIIQKTQNQKWQRWPIRLSKMCRSLQIFMPYHQDLSNLFRNAIGYAILLLKLEKKFTYGGQDLTPYFYQKYAELTSYKQIKKQLQESQTTQQLKEQYKDISDEKSTSQHILKRQRN